MNYYTHYWQNDTWESNRQDDLQETVLAHVSGNSFKKRGVRVGDCIYVVTVKKGKLYLCGKLIVGRFCSVEEVADELGISPSRLWQATEHIAASEATEPICDLEVPFAITKQLQFISGGTRKPLTFISNEKLDQQTLRGVRSLEPNAAVALDSLLKDLQPIEFLKQRETSRNKTVSLWENEGRDEGAEDYKFESGIEGNKKQRYTTYYERLPENRKQAIKIHGVTCKACGFNFEKKIRFTRQRIYSRSSYKAYFTV